LSFGFFSSFSVYAHGYSQEKTPISHLPDLALTTDAMYALNDETTILNAIRSKPSETIVFRVQFQNKSDEFWISRADHFIRYSWPFFSLVDAVWKMNLLLYDCHQVHQINVMDLNGSVPIRTLIQDAFPIWAHLVEEHRQKVKDDDGLEEIKDWTARLSADPRGTLANSNAARLQAALQKMFLRGDPIKSPNEDPFAANRKLFSAISSLLDVGLAVYCPHEKVPLFPPENIDADEPPPLTPSAPSSSSLPSEKTCSVSAYGVADCSA